MDFIVAKLLLPVLLPVFLAVIKAGMEKALPSVYSKVPKQVWMVLVPALAEASAQYSPELFLFPGLPAWASTAFYTLGSYGSREFMTQITKMVNGDTAPAKTILTPATQPSGI